MKKLTSNTLVDIFSHNNKLIKLNKYLIESGNDLLIKYLASVVNDDDRISLIEMFHKDLKSTVSNIKDVYLLLSTVNENDIVLHIDNEEKDLKVIFGENYDAKTKTIYFPSFFLNLKNSFDEENITAQIINKILGIDEIEYSMLIKQRKVIFELDKENLVNEEDKILYLARAKTFEKADEIINKIIALKTDYLENYKQYSFNDRKIIDTQLDFTRANIISVTKDSTYFDEKEIFQLARKHKIDDVKKIQKLMIESNFLNQIELDKSTDVNAVYELLNSIEKQNFKLEDKVNFKVRKLGNYRADGFYYRGHNIVALDVENPSAGFHEFTHASDYEYDGRSELIEYFDSKMKRDIENNPVTGYFANKREIMARLGEISFLFTKYGYDKNKETVSDFFERALNEEKQTDKYDLRILSPIKYYLDVAYNEYFNLKEWESEDVEILQNYFKNFIYNSEVKNDFEITANKKMLPNQNNDIKSKKIIKRNVKNKEINSLSYITSDSVRYTLDYNEKHKIIEQSYFVELLVSNITKLGRLKEDKKYTEYQEHLSAMETIVDYIKEKNDTKLYAVLAKSIHEQMFNEVMVASKFQLCLMDNKLTGMYSYYNMDEKFNKENFITKENYINSFLETIDLKMIKDKVINNDEKDYMEFIKSYTFEKYNDFIKSIEKNQPEIAFDTSDPISSKNNALILQTKEFDEINKLMKDEYNESKNYFKINEKKVYSSEMIIKLIKKPVSALEEYIQIPENKSNLIEEMKEMKSLSAYRLLKLGKKNINRSKIIIGEDIFSLLLLRLNLNEEKLNKNENYIRTSITMRNLSEMLKEVTMQYKREKPEDQILSNSFDKVFEESNKLLNPIEQDVKDIILNNMPKLEVKNISKPKNE